MATSSMATAISPPTWTTGIRPWAWRSSSPAAAASTPPRLRLLPRSVSPRVGGKLIGVDVDQSANIDTYGEGMCVTSAMKGLAETVKHMLGEVVAGNFANYGGQVETLGLVNGDDPTANYVQLPMETTQWGDGFTQDDYKALVKAMYDGDVTVSNDISAMPATTITVNFAGNIK